MSNQQIAQRGATQPAPQKLPFSAALNSATFQKSINNTLRDPERSKRFCASITSAVAVNPALQECTPQTIISAALLGESLNLSPSPQLGQYYLVPFKNKAKYNRQGELLKPETMDAQFVLGYKGYIQLAIRSGYYKRINVLPIKAGELVRWDPIYEEAELEIEPDEEKRETLATIGYLASFEYLNGFRKTLYWSYSKMERHALQYSKGYAAKKGYTFWEKDFDAMAQKTMLRQLISKWGIMSTELQRAFEEDRDLEEVAGDDSPVEPTEPPIVENNGVPQADPAPVEPEGELSLDDI